MQAEQQQAYWIWQAERGLRFPFVQAPRQRVIFLTGERLQDEEAALLAKMMAAMRLPTGAAAIVDHADSATLAAAELVIVLGDQVATRLAAGEPWADQRGSVTFVARLGAHFLVTSHPRDLLQDPSRKRQAWADLQVAMSTLKL